MARLKKNTNSTAANIGYEAELWQMADALRGSMDAAEYKHVVLGLLFLKYILQAFDHIVKSIRRKIRSNTDQSHTLAAQRDALLPKLLSGEVRVKG